MTDKLERVRALLGQAVEVTLGEVVVTRGQLIAIDEGGEVVIRDEMGLLHWCWPMVDISPYPQGPDGSRQGDA